MKKLLAFLLLSNICFSQSIKFSGLVFNSKKEVVSNAKIIISGQLDSLKIFNSLSNEKGYFEIGQIQTGKYNLSVAINGFKEFNEVLNLENDVVNKEIILQEISNKLDEVVIQTKKPTIKRKIDRLEFNVENTILATNNAWEIIKKTPEVQVSGSDISIRGSNSILVTINDKKIYLTGEELKNLLESTNGDDVKTIEVITNPPAKYDAQGSAVLNIKLKKNLKLGYKSSIKTSYVQSTYPKFVTSTTQFYKSKKLSVFGNYSFGTGTYIRFGEDVVVYEEQKQTWKSIMNRKNKSLSQNTYRLNLDYEIDSLNTISFGADGFISPKNIAKYEVPTAIFNENNKKISSYLTKNNRETPQKNSSYNLSFEHKFKNKKTLNFSADYTNYNYFEKQDVDTKFNFAGTPEFSERFVSDNKQFINLFSSQVDFQSEKDKSTFETGLKFGNVNAKSNLIFQELESNLLVNKPNKSNNFNYDETILAGYASFSIELSKWEFQVGLRAEYTDLKGISINPKEENIQDYLKFFPTLYAMYKPNSDNQIGISYGKRISRPNYSWLNPSKSYYNKFSYFVGDANLKPTITHNISLLYTLKSKFNFDLYYRNELNPSIEISFQDPTTNTLIYNFTNIEKDEAFGLDFSCNLNLKTWWSIGLNTTFMFTEDTFQGIDKQIYKNNVFGFNSSINQQFTFNKSKNFNGEINFSYNSPSVQGTFDISESSSLQIGLVKKFFDDNFSLALLLSDVYQGERQKVSTNYANQNNYFLDYRDTQSFRINLKYNIGNQKLTNKTNKEKTEEQKRL
jgi:Outer membrane protein beta-barrel family/CarboxypepD_reg-like domain